MKSKVSVYGARRKSLCLKPWRFYAVEDCAEIPYTYYRGEKLKRVVVYFVLIFIACIIAAGDDGQNAIDEAPATVDARSRMVSTQLGPRGISDLQVLNAMRSVPRHLFMPKSVQNQAYNDHAVPIGGGQTISQPYIVALMTMSLELEKDFRVLEIGTGSGYQAAVLASIVDEVFTIEIREDLHERSSRTLADLGFSNVQTHHADGYYGWEEHAPFDAIMITAAVDHIPQPLIRQLKEGGKLILPLGNPFSFQDLVLAEKRGGKIELRFVTGVLFVPMTGKALD